MIDEVVKNGYKYDLCLECKKDDNCKHEYYSILNIVDEKLNCARHKQMHIIHRVVTVIMTCVQVKEVEVIKNGNGLIIV